MKLSSQNSNLPAVTLATVSELRDRIRRKSRLKGRPLHGHRRDLLIESLHRLNGAWRGLHERHLAALAREIDLPLAEAYEVVPFHHHF